MLIAHSRHPPAQTGFYTHFIARSYLVFISLDNRKTNFKSTFTAGGWYSRDT